MTRWMVLVCGSREWTDTEMISAALDLLPAGTLVLHGAAEGADRLAAGLARSRGFGVWGMPYFEDYGRAGGPRRNAAMLDLLLTARKHGYQVKVLAFDLGTKGTADMIRRAEERRVPVQRFTPRETP